MEMAGEILGQLLAACVGTAAFSALFGVPKKYWLDCGICGAVGWGVYLVVMVAYQTPIIGIFAARIQTDRILSRQLRVRSFGYHPRTQSYPYHPRCHPFGIEAEDRL